MANLTWNLWYLQTPSGPLGYEGTGTVTVTREHGSDTATVTASVNMTVLGWDIAAWRLHMVVGEMEYTYTTAAGHVPDTPYSMSIQQSIPVGTGAGSLTIHVYMTVVDYEQYPGGVSEKKKVTMKYGDKGASTITSAANKTLGNAVDIRWTPFASTFKYKLKFSLGTWHHTTAFITPGSTSAYTYTGYTLPATNAVISQIPDSRKAAMTVTLYSYDANEQKIGADTKTFTVTVPSSVVPSITSCLLSGVDSTFNRYVVGYSSLTINCVAAGIYGSVPKTAVFAVGNKTYTAEFTLSNDQYTASVTSDPLDQAGTIVIVTTVTDSRGLSATFSQNLTVYDYHAPQISDIRISTSDSATTLTVRATGEISPVNNLNAKYIRIQKTKISTSTTTDIVAKTALSGYTVDQTVTVTISDIETESYLITVTLYDSKYTNGVSANSRSGIVCVSRLAGGLGLAIFREATVDDYGRIGIKGFVRLQGRATDDDPSGWLNAANNGLFNYRQDGTQVFVVGRDSAGGNGGFWAYDTNGKLRFTLSATEAMYLYHTVNNARKKHFSQVKNVSTWYDDSENTKVQISGATGNIEAYGIVQGAQLRGALQNSMFRINNVTAFQGSLAGDDYSISTKAYTIDSGWHPIGCIGFGVTTSDGPEYARYMNVFRCAFGWSNSNPYIFYSICNTGTNTRTATLTAYVLEIKVPAS